MPACRSRVPPVCGVPANVLFLCHVIVDCYGGRLLTCSVVGAGPEGWWYEPTVLTYLTVLVQYGCCTGSGLE